MTDQPSPEAGEDLTALDEAAVELTTKEFGRALTLDQSLALLKCIKIIASVDGLSGDEIGAFDQRMRAIGVPRNIRQRVALFDAASTSIEDILEDIPRKSRFLRYFLITALGVAQVDGYSEAEQDAIHRTAKTLGINARYTLALETSERLGDALRNHGNTELYDLWLQLRYALLDLPDFDED